MKTVCSVCASPDVVAMKTGVSGSAAPVYLCAKCAELADNAVDQSISFRIVDVQERSIRALSTEGSISTEWVFDILLFPLSRRVIGQEFSMTSAELARHEK